VLRTVRVLSKASVCSFGTVCFLFGLSCQGREKCFSLHHDDDKIASGPWVRSPDLPGDLDRSRNVDRNPSLSKVMGRESVDKSTSAVDCVTAAPVSETAEVFLSRDGAKRLSRDGGKGKGLSVGVEFGFKGELFFGKPRSTSGSGERRFFGVEDGE
jgi:hypothetical protein